MFLRHTKRWKDGKVHYYWSLVENRRYRGNKIIRHTVFWRTQRQPEGAVNPGHRSLQRRSRAGRSTQIVRGGTAAAGVRGRRSASAAQRLRVARSEAMGREPAVHRSVAGTTFGGRAWAFRAKAPIGNTCCKLWVVTGSWTRAASFPTTDGRTLIFSRYTTPNKTQKLLLAQLDLPPQSQPRITSAKILDPLPA